MSDFSGIVFSTVFLFIGCIAGFILMIVFYTDSVGCTTNKAFIGVNWTLVVVVSVLAISPKIQERKLYKIQKVFVFYVMLSCSCFVTNT